MEHENCSCKEMSALFNQEDDALAMPVTSPFAFAKTSTTSMGVPMEVRGVSFDLFVAVGAVALKLHDCKEYWSTSRISAFCIGNHELLQGRNQKEPEKECRWYKDVEKDDSLPPDSVKKLISILDTKEDTLTFKEQCSLIDILQERYIFKEHEKLCLKYENAVGKKSAAFVSFTYQDNYFELIESLEVYFEDHPEIDKKSTYFWFDLFVNDQWKALHRGFEWWESTFDQAIKGIGITLGFVCPWRDPSIFKRAWCLFEISCTKADKFAVILSKRQKDSLQDMFLRDFDLIWKNVSSIDLEKAEAYLPEDKENIFKKVRSEGGFETFNKRVKKLIEDWIEKSLESFDSETDLEKKDNLNGLFKSPSHRKVDDIPSLNAKDLIDENIWYSVENAHKKIDLEVHRLEMDSLSKILTSEAREHEPVLVAENGGGIPVEPALKDSNFELGLEIWQKIIEAEGWKVSPEEEKIAREKAGREMTNVELLLLDVKKAIALTDLKQNRDVVLADVDKDAILAPKEYLIPAPFNLQTWGGGAIFCSRNSWVNNNSNNTNNDPIYSKLASVYPDFVDHIKAMIDLGLTEYQIERACNYGKMSRKYDKNSLVVYAFSMDATAPAGVVVGPNSKFGSNIEELNHSNNISSNSNDLSGKLVRNRSLGKLSASDVASQVESLGRAYHVYSEGILSNDIDGSLLYVTIDIEGLWDEIFDCIGCNSIVHKRRITRHFSGMVSVERGSGDGDGCVAAFATVKALSTTDPELEFHEKRHNGGEAVEAITQTSQSTMMTKIASVVVTVLNGLPAKTRFFVGHPNMKVEVSAQSTLEDLIARCRVEFGVAQNKQFQLFTASSTSPVESDTFNAMLKSAQEHEQQLEFRSKYCSVRGIACEVSDDGRNNDFLEAAYDVMSDGGKEHTKRCFFYCEPCMNSFLTSHRKPRGTFFAHLVEPRPDMDVYRNLPATVPSLFETLKLPREEDQYSQFRIQGVLMRDIPCPFREAPDLLLETWIYNNSIYNGDQFAIEQEFNRFNMLKPKTICCMSETMYCESPDYRDTQGNTNMIQLGCSHWFHKDCLAPYIRTEIDSEWFTNLNSTKVAVCPECKNLNDVNPEMGICTDMFCCQPDQENIVNPGCHKYTQREFREIFSTLSEGNPPRPITTGRVEEYLDKYERVSSMKFLKNSPSPAGEKFILCKCKQFGENVASHRSFFRCEFCNADKCVECLDDWHANSTCRQANAVKAKKISDDAGIVSRFCPRSGSGCMQFYSIPIACRHSTCIAPDCGFGFCYNCGVEYNSQLAHGLSYHYPECFFFKRCCENDCCRKEEAAKTPMNANGGGNGGAAGGKWGRDLSYSAHIGLNPVETKARMACIGVDKPKFQPGPCAGCFEVVGKHNLCTHSGYKCWDSLRCKQWATDPTRATFTDTNGTKGYICRHYCKQCHYLGQTCQPLKQPTGYEIIAEDTILAEEARSLASLKNKIIQADSEIVSKIKVDNKAENKKKTDEIRVSSSGLQKVNNPIYTKLASDYPDFLHHIQTMIDIGLTEYHIERVCNYGKLNLASSRNPQQADRLTMKANIQYMKGNLEDAYNLYFEAYYANLSSRGADHPRVFDSERNLANSLVAWGRKEEAEGHFRNVLKDRERVLGPDHPDTKTSRTDLESLSNTE